MHKTLAWGILGTGRIARRFAVELPHAQWGRLVAVGSRTQAAGRARLPRVADPRRLRQLRRAAGRPGGGRGLYLAAQPPARAVDHPLRRGGQAHPVRKAAGHQPCRGDDRHRGGARPRRLSDGSLHVPLPSRRRPSWRADPRRRHRRGAPDPGLLQLQHGAGTPGEHPPAERGLGRRHHGRRLLHRIDGPPGGRGGHRQATLPIP